MNSLITQNNKQFEVNTQLNTRINHLLESVNKHEVAENRELEVLQILAKLNDVNYMIKNIMDAILNSKIKQPNSKLLTISELAAIQRLLTKQGVPTSTLEEALEYAQPLIATQKEKLIYILKIPQLQEQPGEILKLFSLPVNKRKIIGIPTTIVKFGTKFFIPSKDDFIYNLQEFRDNCLSPILHNLNGSCTVEKDEKISSVLIAEDKVLVTNAENTVL